MAQDSPYKGNIKTGNLPSGMNQDDYLQFIREKMYFALNPSKIVDEVNAESIAATMLGNTTIDAGNNDGAYVAAAKLFTFPGYIVFTLMEPIVEDFDMLSLRSDLLMTSTPVFSSTTEKKLAGQARARQQLQESKQKRQHCNDEDDGLDDSSKLTRSTAASIEPAHATLLATHSKRLQAAGIAQSRLAHLGKKKAKLNDRILSMHLKRVTGKQSITLLRSRSFSLVRLLPTIQTDTCTYLTFGSSILNWHLQFKT